MTEAKPLTEEGTILGTFQYMAPEQLDGREADARTDLFALGAVLYEMLTGQKAFRGKTQASLITAIMSTEPPPSSLRAVTPKRLGRRPRAMSRKGPGRSLAVCRRFEPAGDLSWELGRLTDAEVRPPAERAGHSTLPWVAAVLAGMAAIVLGVRSHKFTLGAEAGDPVVAPGSGRRHRRVLHLLHCHPTVAR